MILVEIPPASLPKLGMYGYLQTEENSTFILYIYQNSFCQIEFEVEKAKPWVILNDENEALELDALAIKRLNKNLI